MRYAAPCGKRSVMSQQGVGPEPVIPAAQIVTYAAKQQAPQDAEPTTESPSQAPAHQKAGRADFTVLNPAIP